MFNFLKPDRIVLHENVGIGPYRTLMIGIETQRWAFGFGLYDYGMYNGTVESLQRFKSDHSLKLFVYRWQLIYRYTHKIKQG